jgi:hypothetical protein
VQQHRVPAGVCPLGERASSSGDLAVPGCLQGELVLEDAHRNLTVKQLLAVGLSLFPSLAEYVGSQGNVGKLDFKLADRKASYALGQTLNEIGCIDGAKVFIGPRADGGDGRMLGASDGDESSVLHLMSEWSLADGGGETVTVRYKHLLASLQQLEDGGNDKELGEVERTQLQEQLWRLLESLPTAGYIQRQVEDAIRCQGKKRWQDLLDSRKGIWRSAYLLQVVEAMLQRGFDVPHNAGTSRNLAMPNDGESLRDESQRRISDFVTQGGAEKVLELVALVCREGREWCHPARISWRTCTPVFLRLLRLLLSYLHDGSAPRHTLSSNLRLHQQHEGQGREVRRNGLRRQYVPPCCLNEDTRNGTDSSSGDSMEEEVHSETQVKKVTQQKSKKTGQQQPSHAVTSIVDNVQTSPKCTVDKASDLLREHLAEMVNILLQAVVKFSTEAPPASTKVTTEAAVRPCRSARRAVNNVGSISNGGKSHEWTTKGVITTEAMTSESITSVIRDALSLLHMVITSEYLALKSSPVKSLPHCHNIVRCIFQRSAISGGGGGVQGVGRGARDGVSCISMAEALIRQILVAGNDEGLRKLTSEMLFEERNSEIYARAANIF